MKEGFTFNWASIKFLRKFTSKNFDGGGGNRKEPINVQPDRTQDEIKRLF